MKTVESNVNIQNLVMEINKMTNVVVGNNLEPEKDIVAISFISPEDLERVHAPNGIFREVEPGYLSPREQVPEHHVADALHALEGRSTTSQESSIESSIRSPPSVKNPDLGHSLNSDDKAELTNLQSSDAKKRSSIRDLFRRTKSESQPESSKPGLQRRCTLRKPRRDTVAKENTTFDVRFMLSAMLQRVNVAANKGNLKAVRKECDDLMAMAPPSESDIESEKVPVQAFEFREGTLIQDTAGSLRYINSETVKAITSALRRTPIAHWAKIKVSILSTRAYLSTQEGDYNDAYWSYRQVSNTLRQHPMLFPDVIWHAVILTNLAHLSARLGRPDDEERYYLKALSISYKRYGRRDLNNINFLTALATAYEKNTQTKTAAELFKRSLFARIEISGPDDNDTLMAMQELAAINAKLGDLEVAKLLYERCLGGFEIQLGLEHKVTLLIVDRLCNTYLQLQAQDDALALYTRAFPYLCAVCDSDDELLRTWLSQYIQHTRNFGFPEQISAVLRKYRDNPTEKNVSVLQNLARIYMLGGLLADALELFELVFKARRRIQKHDPAALDALHGHCLALECMDKIDAAHTAYTNLVQLALQLPDGNDGKKRALNARIRLGALEERKKVLSHEKDAWQLDMPGPCGICHSATTLLCPKCQISRFCGEACRDLASGSHNPACHPSVTLCESKSVTATPSVPHRIERQVIERLSYQDLRNGVKATIYRVSNSFTISYDARNFTTFRVKLNSQRHTYLFFDRDADIRFAIIDPSAPAATAESESESDSRPHERTSNLQPRRATDEQQPLFKWTTPRETEPLLLRRGSETYLLVSPGRKLFQEHIAKRRAVRMQDSEHLERLDLPDAEMVEFCQGLVLEQSERQPVGFAGKNGRMGRRFAYLVEVE